MDNFNPEVMTKNGKKPSKKYIFLLKRKMNKLVNNCKKNKKEIQKKNEDFFNWHDFG